MATPKNLTIQDTLISATQHIIGAQEKIRTTTASINGTSATRHYANKRPPHFALNRLCG